MVRAKSRNPSALMWRRAFFSVRKIAIDPAQGGEAVRTSPVPEERKDAPR